MKRHRILALPLAFALASGGAPTALLAQQTATIAGTAKDEAKKPYPENSVRARDVQQGTVPQGATVNLNSEGNFVLPDLSAARYVVELVNKDGKVVCTEGPFDITQQMLKNDVVINCSKVPLGLIILGAGGAAGITAGILAGGPASAAQ